MGNFTVAVTQEHHELDLPAIYQCFDDPELSYQIHVQITDSGLDLSTNDAIEIINAAIDDYNQMPFGESLGVFIDVGVAVNFIVSTPWSAVMNGSTELTAEGG